MKQRIWGISLILFSFSVGALVGFDLRGSFGLSADTRSKNLSSKMPLFYEAWNTLNRYYYKEIDLQPEEVVMGAVAGMVNTLKDPYTQFSPPIVTQNISETFQGAFGGVGILVDFITGRMRVVSVLPNTPADQAGLKAGDLILQIDGKAVEDLDPLQAVERIRGKIGTTVILSIWREGFLEPKDFPLQRKEIQVPSVSDAKILQGSIGYLKILEFNKNTPQQVRDAVKELQSKGAKGFILDLRYNPGGIFESGIEVADIFLKEGTLVTLDSKTRKESFTAKPGDIGESLPLVILVNRYTASASEILASALHDNHRAVLIGETTLGKGIVQAMIPLSNNSSLMIVTGRYLTPKGEYIHQKGISPDIPIELDPRKVQSEKGKQLLEKLKKLEEESLSLRDALLEDINEQILQKGISTLQKQLPLRG